MRNYSVNATITFPDGINRGALTVKAESESDAMEVAKERLVDIWKVDSSKIKINSVRKLSAGDKMKTIDSSKHMAAGDDENTVSSSDSMKETTQKIEQAGIEETPAGETLEQEPVFPEPKKKTPQEMMENPQDISDGHEDGDEPNEEKDVTPKDPLSVEDNDEQLESMKNKNADGDEEIKKDGVHKFAARQKIGGTTYKNHDIILYTKDPKKVGGYMAVVDGEWETAWTDTTTQAMMDARKLIDEELN